MIACDGSWATRLGALRSALVALAAFAVTASGCGTNVVDEPPAPQPAGAARTDPDAVHVEGRAFRDGRGRQLLFRGYNVKVDGIFDVSFDDGRAANYAFPSFDEADATRLEELGLDVVRLTMSWSALEPKPLAYGEAFLAKVGQVLAWASAHHFYVVLDVHQDAYSKEIGEDGAPLWAIIPVPSKVLSGPSDDTRRLSDAALSAGYSFFGNEPATDGRPLQDALASAVAVVAKRVAGDPRVLGYEAFNEPIALRSSDLHDFHARFATALHAVDRDAPVLFEPLATRNQFDKAEVAEEPWSNGPGAYAPHIYTSWFSQPSQDNWASEDPGVLQKSMQAAANEAEAWSTPLFVTEFGCDQSIDRGPRWLAAELDLQDRFLASSTAWVWGEAGAWGLSDLKHAEKPATAKVVARSYPRAVAGDLVAIEHPAPGHMKVRYIATARTAGLLHEVSMSDAYATDWHVLCDGAEVTPVRAPGRATFVCPADAGEHAFEVSGTPLP